MKTKKKEEKSFDPVLSNRFIVDFKDLDIPPHMVRSVTGPRTSTLSMELYEVTKFESTRKVITNFFSEFESPEVEFSVSLIDGTGNIFLTQEFVAVISGFDFGHLHLELDTPTIITVDFEIRKYNLVSK